MESCFNILINRWYLPSSIFCTYLCGNGGGGLGTGTIFLDNFASYIVASSNSPLLLLHHFLSHITFYYKWHRWIDGLLTPRVVIVMQCPSFFGFLIVLLGRVPGWLGFIVVENDSFIAQGALLRPMCIPLSSPWHSHQFHQIPWSSSTTYNQLVPYYFYCP